VQYFHDCIELGLNVTAQGTIEVFPGDARLFRDLRHSSGTRHIANGFGNQSLVIGLERLGKIGRYHLGAVEIFSRIEWFGFCHAQSSNSLANFLARFMSAAWRYIAGISKLKAIDPLRNLRPCPQVP
jgi:hypothetical protein